MNGNFNGQILVDKLMKLNSTQQSIETLSHWCIFHRRKAKQVVETWAKHFQCSPREQWVSLLYLANDILQNSRWKGSEFVDEFWIVLPDALRNVLENGDGAGRNAALRLINIWEERKVFGSRGRILKEDVLGKKLETNSRNEDVASFKLKQCTGKILEKLILGYEHVYDGPRDEGSVLNNCQAAISCIEKIEKENCWENSSGNISGSKFSSELQEQRSILGICIQQLKESKSSRLTLVSSLREALHEEEIKLEEVHNQLQAAQAQYESAADTSKPTDKDNGQLPVNQRLHGAGPVSNSRPAMVSGTQINTGESQTSNHVMYTKQSFSDSALHTLENLPRTAAIGVVSKALASTSSEEICSYVPAAVVTEDNADWQVKEGCAVDNKKPKLENGTSHVPSYPQITLSPHFANPNTFQQMPSSQPVHQHPSPLMVQPDCTNEMQAPPPPPPSEPPMQPPPPPLPSEFLQNAGSVPSIPYNYGSVQHQWAPSFVSYPNIAIPPYSVMPPNPYQVAQAPGNGAFFNQPPWPSTMPPSYQQ